MITKNPSPLKSLPIIAIIGRPNVGKSSLFNCLAGKRLAITYEEAGTTRDNIYHRLELNDGFFAILVDTGGIECGKKENIEADIQSQVKIGLTEADLILFVVDIKTELTANDYEAAKLLRKSNKNIILIANKCDHSSHETNGGDLLKLGFDEPIKTSTIHKNGIRELKKTITERLEKQGWKKQEIAQGTQKEIETIKIAFVGKPNVGKSSLVNAIIGRQKLIVSKNAGTTRDATDTVFEFQNRDFTLIDTAGLRRRGKIAPGLEKLSSFRALEAIERSDIVCLLLDYENSIGAQDLHIASYVIEAKKGLMLVVNKSDFMQKPKIDREIFIRKLQRKFDFLSWAPVIFVSALKKTNLNKIFEIAIETTDQRQKWIDKEELYSFMNEIVYKHTPPQIAMRATKFYSLEQTAVNPPTFIFLINNDYLPHFSYRRYLENEIRRKYGFVGTAIRVFFRAKRQGLDLRR